MAGDRKTTPNVAAPSRPKTSDFNESDFSTIFNVTKANVSSISYCDVDRFPEHLIVFSSILLAELILKRILGVPTKDWAWLLGLCLFRFAIASRNNLGVDEAHYVLYGLNLDWSYFDHPPL